MTTASSSLPPIPVPDELTKPFWDAALEGHLVIQRCQECKRYYHPPRLLCPKCVSSTLAFEEINGKGTIYAYSIMYDQRVAGFEDKIPYINVVVELVEQPLLTMVTNLLDAQPQDLKIGLPVKVTYQRLTDEITLPQFKLVR